MTTKLMKLFFGFLLIFVIVYGFILAGTVDYVFINVRGFLCEGSSMNVLLVFINAHFLN